MAKHNPSAQAVMVEGKVYKNMKACCNDINISRFKLINRLLDPNDTGATYHPNHDEMIEKEFARLRAIHPILGDVEALRDWKDSGRSINDLKSHVNTNNDQVLKQAYIMAGLDTKNIHQAIEAESVFRSFITNEHPHIELGDWIRVDKPMKMRCTRHDHSFSVKPMIARDRLSPCPICMRELRRESANDPDVIARRMVTYKKTCMERYGVESVMQLKEVKDRCSRSRYEGNWCHVTGQKRAEAEDAEWLQTRVNEGHAVADLASYFEVPPDTMYGQLSRMNIDLTSRITSSGERKLAEMVEGMGFVVERNNRRLLGGMEIDVYIPSLNLGFEYNGCHWHSDAVIDKDRHKEKQDRAEAAGVRLITIWEDTMNAHPEKVERFVINVLGKNPSRLNARVGVVKDISHKEFTEFLDVHHMQGGTHVAHVRLGLFIDDRLVSVMGFRRAAKNVKVYGDNAHELVRFASVGVRGSFGKLESHFIRHHSPRLIYSFADREIVSPASNVYLTMGYKETSRLAPDYRYCGNKTGWVRDHKFKWRKDRFAALGIDITGKTESELAKEIGINRCWDSGKICYVKEI